jgi:hypothetical protein
MANTKFCDIDDMEDAINRQYLKELQQLLKKQNSFIEALGCINS